MTPYLVAPSPHWSKGSSTGRIMSDVLLAMLPALAWAGLCFGYRAFLVVAVCVAAASAAEAACQRIMGRAITLHDGSAVLTGALLAAVLPANIPLWFAALGAAFAIAIGKQAFGGLGSNIWNPALLARAAMGVSMPAHMYSSQWPSLAGGSPGFGLGHLAKDISGSFGALSQRGVHPDIVTSPTALAKIHALPSLDAPDASRCVLEDSASWAEHLSPSWERIRDAWLGLEGGSLGEVSAVCLLAGGLYLLFRRVITWETPAAFLGMAALGVFVLPAPIETVCHLHGGGEAAHAAYQWVGTARLALLHLGSGGLMLGAFFMATDYVTTPLTRRGKFIFGAGCGFLTILIRFYGGYPEGICFAILLMNTATPLIDSLTRPRLYGKRPQPRAPAP